MSQVSGALQAIANAVPIRQTERCVSALRQALFAASKRAMWSGIMFAAQAVDRTTDLEIAFARHACWQLPGLSTNLKPTKIAGGPALQASKSLPNNVHSQLAREAAQQAETQIRFSDPPQPAINAYKTRIVTASVSTTMLRR